MDDDTKKDARPTDSLGLPAFLLVHNVAYDLAVQIGKHARQSLNHSRVLCSMQPLRLGRLGACLPRSRFLRGQRLTRMVLSLSLWGVGSQLRRAPRSRRAGSGCCVRRRLFREDATKGTQRLLYTA